MLLLKRHFWIINLILVSAFVWTLSSLTMTMVERKLRVPLKTTVFSDNSVQRPAAPVKPLSYYQNIINDNIFDPGTRHQPAPPPSPVKSGDKSVNGQVQASPLPYKLIGTVFSVRQNRCFAVLIDLGKKTQDLYRINDKLADAVVTAIYVDRVVLKRNGQDEAIYLDETKDKQMLPAGPGPAKSKQIVEQVSSDKYILDREEVNKAITNVNQFMTELRVRPHFSGGQPDGFYVSDIKQGSLIEKLGVKNGDVIKKVNGMSMTKPEEAFAAYQQLQNESAIQL
ncbi:MAG: hypothetical protein HQK56_13340, partial [Deltaproteobacteria bacterium]|nr:hypothetical protein [Deltaproteobacteria bacterium]